jgi:glyoxalase/bleomycin resistance protein/dioxygenase superfamily protein
VQPYFQVGFVVPDLEAAMEEMGASLGVEMVAPQERDVGIGTLRISFALTPPPYIELIQGPPGSVWDATGGSRIHHLGYWSEDMDADSARLEAGGMPLELDLGYARYHRSAAGEGVRIELIALAHRATFFTRWALPER